MFYCVDEVCSSTTVNFSAYGKIIPGPGEELLTVGGKWLRIFRLNPYGSRTSKNKQDVQLEQVYQLKLLEEPNNVVIINSKNTDDNVSLVSISFPDYRVTINKWDSRLNELVAISHHDFAMDISISVSKTCKRESQFLAADGSGTMVVTTLPDSHLGIVPLGVYATRSQETISLKHLKIRLKNVLAIAFTAGYVKPTLLILYDAMKTNIGRAVLVPDTTALAAICLDLDTGAHSIIWHTKSLPSDLKILLPLPYPVGGALLVGVNHILYMNQNCAPQGIAINSCSEEFTKFPVKSFHHLEVALQSPVATVISGCECLIGSAKGQLYSVHLTTNETSSVNDIYLLKLCEIPSPASISRLSPGYVFVGSHVGSHLLLEYTKQEFTFNQVDLYPDLKEEEEEIPITEEVREIEEFLFERVLSSENEKARGRIKVSGLQIRKIDEVFNYGPIKSMKPFPPDNISDKFKLVSNYPTFDVVATTGHGNDSSITLLQKSLRPIIIRENVFPVGTQFYGSILTDNNDANYVIASKDRDFQIFSVDRQMSKLRNFGFDEEEETMLFGTAVKGKYCVQVTKTRINVSKEGRLLSTTPLNLDAEVGLVKYKEPLLVLVTKTGNLHVFRLKEQDNQLLVKRRSFQGGKYCLNNVTSFDIIKDKSSIFSTKIVNDGDERPSKFRKLRKTDFDIGNEFEHALYEINNATEHDLMANKEISIDDPSKNIRTSAVNVEKTLNSYCVCVVFKDCRMVIYLLPQLIPVFQTDELLYLPGNIWDNSFIKKRLTLQKEVDELNEINLEGTVDYKKTRIVRDITFLSCGINGALQFMCVRINNQIAFYQIKEMFGSRPDRPVIMFTRLHQHWDVSSVPYGDEDETVLPECDYQKTFYYLKQLDNYHDVIMIAGQYPAFFHVGKHFTVLHPFNVEGCIQSYIPINSKLHGHTFGYVTQNGTLVQARLDSTVDYSIPYPAKKMPKRVTVHHVVPIVSRNLVVLVTSEEVELNRVWYPVNDEKFSEKVNASKGFVYPKGPLFKVALYTLNNWQEVPDTEIKFPDHEYVTTCTEVRLQIEENPRTVQSYIAVGTSFNQGEEIQARGRILLYEIIEVVANTETGTFKEKLKEVYGKEHKDGITALTALNGYLMSGMGTKVFIWQYHDGELDGVSFLDRNVFITKLVAFRDLLIVEDVCNGLSIMRYQPNYKVLSVVAEEGRKFLRLTMSSDFIFRDGKMAFVHGDKSGNLTFYGYEGSGLSSRNICELAVRSEIYLSSAISSFCSLKSHNNDPFFMQREDYCRRRQVLMYGKLDGTIGFIDTIDEEPYRRLAFLQNILCRVMPQGCKLNFRISKAVDPIPHPVQTSLRNVLDITFIRQFFFLDWRVQQKIARRTDLGCDDVTVVVLSIENETRKDLGCDDVTVVVLSIENETRKGKLNPS
uniref:CPSF_A domain-containing protein n=1 Tax=Rhabditophanes sp. KR3021 TaxID=114890 RepID=A0AC35TTF2_9BILA